jgi:hypothetical protein
MTVTHRRNDPAGKANAAADRRALVQSHCFLSAAVK